MEKQPVTILTRQLPAPSDRITVHYPVITGMRNVTVQNALNRKIITAYNELLISQNFFDKSVVELIGYFEIKTNERGILSISLIVYSFTGGAHGLTVVKSLTLDTESGKEYRLENLFKPGSSYIRVLSDIIRKKIKDYDITLLDPPFTNIKPDQDFYIADHALVIYFQLYEIAPYAWGFPYFPIPVLDIQDIIAENGPLQRFLPFT